MNNLGSGGGRGRRQLRLHCSVESRRGWRRPRLPSWVDVWPLPFGVVETWLDWVGCSKTPWHFEGALTTDQRGWQKPLFSAEVTKTSVTPFAQPYGIWSVFRAESSTGLPSSTTIERAFLKGFSPLRNAATGTRRAESLLGPLHWLQNSIIFAPFSYKFCDFVFNLFLDATEMNFWCLIVMHRLL